MTPYGVDRRSTRCITADLSVCQASIQAGRKAETFVVSGQSYVSYR